MFPCRLRSTNSMRTKLRQSCDMAKGIVLRELDSGKSYRVNLPCVIGRSKEADLLLPDAGVSQRHALLEESADHIWIYDLGSLNGVYVNEERIAEKKSLKFNDALRLGHTRFVICEADEHAAEKTLVLRTIALKSTLQLDQQRLKLIYEITSELADTQDLTGLGEKVFFRFKEIFHQDTGHLALFQEDGSLKTIFSTPSSSSVPLSRSITKRLFQNGESFLLQDALDESHLKLQESIIALKIRSALCVPLVYHNQVYGLIYLDRIVPGAYKQADLEFLRTIASILAPLIENTRLWSRLNRNYADALESLKITQARLIDMERTAAYVRLAQAMAHEIRNPLMVIGGLFRRLTKSGSMGLEEDRVQMIMTAVERVEMVLKEVDDFVKLPPLEKKLFKIDHLIQDLIENHKQDWQQRTINPVLSINTSNLMVPLDAQLFAKALSMIFKEIFTSVPAGSIVKIEVDDFGSDLQIAFGDVEEFESVCELFDLQLRSKPWSLGLFLNIAQKIIKDHGGRLLLDPQSSSAFPLIVRIPRSLDF